MLIADLSRHPRFIPILADAFAAEWPEWCASVGRAGVEAIFECDAGGGLPVVLVAFSGDEALGTIALRRWFAEDPMEETPWVRQLYVFPRYRGRGIDRRLGAAIEESARVLGFGSLYAATDRIAPLLMRRGWRVFRQFEHDGRPMIWLAKQTR